MTVKTAVLRFRIWQYASPREWNVTIAEIAEALGESPHRVGVCVQQAGWSARIRATSRDSFGDGVPGTFTYARSLAQQIVAGRVGVDA